MQKKREMRKKKRIYISLPISGRPPELVALKVKEVKELIRKNHTPVSPLDVNKGVKDYAKCMGNDIEAIINCDAVYFVKGWQSSKGCTAEYEIARIYDKEIIFE